MIVALALFALGLAIGQARGRALATPQRAPVAAGAAPGVPSPMTVLAGFVQRGAAPPPIVVGHAIAQAELAGEHRLAHQIVRAFVPKPVIDAVAYEQGGAPAQDDGGGAQVGRGGGGGGGGRGFQGPSAMSMPLDVIEAAPDNGNEGGAPIVGRAVQSAPSPLPGISDDAWLVFQGALANRPPGYATDRRVGRYEQRKDRLRELGCDPDALVRHPRAADLQDAALAIDVADAADHLERSGTCDEYIGADVALDDGGVYRVTLSGLLGVAQVAGLEGCISWFEHAEDRVRFPHTTSVFVRTNGVF